MYLAFFTDLSVCTGWYILNSHKWVSVFVRLLLQVINIVFFFALHAQGLLFLSSATCGCFAATCRFLSLVCIGVVASWMLSVLDMHLCVTSLSPCCEVSLVYRVLLCAPGTKALEVWKHVYTSETLISKFRNKLHLIYLASSVKEDEEKLNWAYQVDGRKRGQKKSKKSNRKNLNFL